MKPENPFKEPNRIDEPYEIVPGVSFRPFESSQQFCIPHDKDIPFRVPERYDDHLLLRRAVAYQKIPGVIDLITEDHRELMSLGVMMGVHPVEKPLGETYFRDNYHKPFRREAIEEPAILRFSFLPRTPQEYARLLNSYVHTVLGSDNYMSFWNMDKPQVRRNLHYLESHEQVSLLIVEKNLFNVHWMEEQIKANPDPEETDEASEDEELGRITYIWLSPTLDPLKTIEMTFDQIDDADDIQEDPITPVEPEKELIPILA